MHIPCLLSLLSPLKSKYDYGKYQANLTMNCKRTKKMQMLSRNIKKGNKQEGDYRGLGR
jgi:hypothetical protein